MLQPNEINKAINRSMNTDVATAESQMRDNHDKGLYYNGSYEIENFINIHRTISEDDDPFDVMSDPTLTGFKLFFHFGADSGLLATENNINSALAYLKRVGEESRYSLLKRFISALSDVSIICPWIFQDISGVKELFERDRGQILHEDSKVEIKTLETLDGKIGSLIKMYRDVVYDEHNRKVWILPENLRKFSMSVYVYDYRMFASNLSEGDNLSTTQSFLQTITNTNIKNLNHTLFDLSDCTFDISSGSTFFENVSNNASTFAENNLSISTQGCYISSLFRTITGDVRLGGKTMELAKVTMDGVGVRGTNPVSIFGKDGKLNLINRLKDTQLYNSVRDRESELKNLLDSQYLKKTGMNILEEGADRLIDRVEAEMAQLYFGNVHGFGIDDILKLNDDNNYKSTFSRTYSKINGNQSLGNSDVYKDDLGNING